MELQHTDPMAKYSNYDLSSGSARTKWYLEKKSFVWIAIVGVILFIGIGIFLGGYYTGLSAHVITPSVQVTTEGISTVETTATANLTSDRTPEPYIHVPDIEWKGVCPKKQLECPESYQGIPPLILVSLDGFHPDYLNRGITPTLGNISQCGTSVPYMYPVFPSKTFPNHYSLVTGLNPASHGIVDNNMYDPIKKKMFKVGTNESRQPYWWEGEPIWVTAQNQGKKSGCFFWPGADVLINGTFPTYYRKYSSKIPFEKRVDTIFEWLELPEDERPNFLTLYVNEPDHAGHYYGTVSPETDAALIKVDNMIARLFGGLQARELLNCVNVIILSDHGMADTSCNRMIKLQDFIDVSQIYSTLGAFGRLRPKGARNSTVIENLLSNLTCKNFMRAYLKEQLPVRCHFAKHRRIEPIYLDLDAGWTITNRDTGPEDSFCSGGNHGYDNLFPEMQALFMAHGPSFKFNHTVAPFMNTEVYEMLTELINITPNANNGTKGSLHHLLVEPETLPPQVAPDPPSIATVPPPGDNSLYNFNVMAANCSCPQNSTQRDVENTTLSDLEHLPFGIPYSPEDNVTLDLLYNDDYITAFDKKYQLPMWTSYSLSRKVNVSDIETCWKGDARIYYKNTSNCVYYNQVLVIDQDILQSPMFPMYFANNSRIEQASYITNSAPKYQNFTFIVEKKLHQTIASWVNLKKSVNIVTGPAFDVDATGVKPDIGSIQKIRAKHAGLPVPTHYFSVITWCQTKTLVQFCNSSHLQVAAFLLPNVPYAYNCESPEDVISKNVARVVDVENLTGISFFTGLPIYDAIRLRTSVPTPYNIINAQPVLEN